MKSLQITPNQINIEGKRYFLKNESGLTNELQSNGIITYCIYKARKVNAAISYFKVVSFIQVSENLLSGKETVLSTYGTKYQINALKNTYDVAI